MASRRVRAVLCSVAPSAANGAPAVALGFRPSGAPDLPERIDDLAALGPVLDLDTVHGLGKVLRLLRAARLAAPGDPRVLLGRAFEVSRRLERALGTEVWLHLRTRSRLRFEAWTEQGLARVDDAVQVVEAADAFWVMRPGGQPPVRLPREDVVRARTGRETWYEVLHIERG